MQVFRQRHEDLEADLSKAYSKLLEDKKEFIFLTEEDILNGDYDEYFEVRSDITGSTYDVHIVRVDEEGIEVVEAEDDSKRYYVGFSDLSEIQDRINLIENMQDYEQVF
jgi:hypothetical protein